MKTFLTFAVWLYFNSVFSQSVTAINASNAAQYLVGNGVTISNAQFTGDAKQLSQFNNLPSTLGLSDGIVLSTNKRDHMNNFLNNGFPNENTGSFSIPTTVLDQDLYQLSGNSNMWSRAYLEFDFVSTGSQISFDLVFASNEYPGYNCCQFNDVFGAFLSGPQIVGSQNIALITGTSTPISINAINNGIPGGACTPSGTCTNVNTSLYNSNTWLYGGSTKVIHVEKNIECQQTYHLKIAICNTTDMNFNSSVFIKKNSFNSNFNLGAVTADIQPICEGQNLTLTTTGSDGYTYNWYTQNGNLVQSGLNLKQITLQANTNTTGYYVTITSPDGCTLIQNLNVIVHSTVNNAPSVNGINNTGEYIAYAHAGEEVCFDIPTFDSQNELTSINWNFNIISATFQPYNSPFQTGTFCWTPQNNTQGSFYFDVTVTDNSACSSLSSVFTFQVNVVCENCHVCISFDGDTPTNAQLPSTVNAGNCILAGLDNPVFVGVDNSVYFQAGNYIELGPAFDTQDGLFEAVIDPVTCLTGCANCCDNFDGFTIDFPFTDVFTPNGDGVNDIFYFKDDDNPTCAFNATKFEFTVLHNWGPTLYYLEGSNLRPDICCPFIAPTNDTPSSIYWDGRVNVGFGVGNMVNAGSYTWTLKLFNCDNSELFHGFLHVWDPQGLAQSNETENQVNRTDVSNNIENQVNSNFTGSLNNELIIYPNPTTDKLNIHSTKEIHEIQFFDNNGKHLFSKMNFFNQPISLINLSSGSYTVNVIFNDKSTIKRNIIKQ
jgi:hypothetical protein